MMVQWCIDDMYNYGNASQLFPIIFSHNQFCQTLLDCNALVILSITIITKLWWALSVKITLFFKFWAKSLQGKCWQWWWQSFESTWYIFIHCIALVMRWHWHRWKYFLKQQWWPCIISNGQWWCFYLKNSLLSSGDNETHQCFSSNQRWYQQWQWDQCFSFNNLY